MSSGWETRTLGEVLAVLRNGVNCKQDKDGLGDKISRIESISNAHFDISKVGFASLSEQEKSRYLLQRGDILFSHINSPIHVGKTAVFDSNESVYHGVNLLLMRPNDSVTPEYLDHALKYIFYSGYWRGVCKQSVNQASVNQQDISKVRISFPKSRTEQQRIVTILDQAFDNIATAIANAERNLANAREVFQSSLQSIFTHMGDGWQTEKLGDVCSLLNRGISPKYLENGGVCVLNQKCIRDHRISYEQSRRHDQSVKAVNPDRLIQLGDVLVNSTGTGTLGRVAQIREHPPEPTTVDSHVTIVRPIPNKFFSDFFGYMLQFIEEEIKEAGEGCGGQTELARSVLAEKFSVTYPTEINEQKSIVTMLDDLSAKTNRLEAIYQQKLVALDELKKSILHQAFTGQLN